MAIRQRAHAGYAQPFRDQRGYWNLQIPNGAKRGRTTYKRIRAKTVEALRAKEKEFLTKVARGQRTGKGVPSLAAFLREWVETTVKTKNHFSTYQRYKGIIEQYLIPYLDPKGTRKIDALERQHVQNMINELLEQGTLAVRSIRNIRNVLRRALNVAMLDGTLVRNVAKAAELPPEPTYSPRVFTTEEARIFLAAVEGSWQQALYWTALLMGFREGELCGFRLEDLDIEKGILYPRKGLRRQKPKKDEKGKLTQIELKTSASQEPLTVPAPLIPILRAQLAKLEEARGMSTWVETGYLFPSTKGTPQEPRNLVRQFKGILKQADLPDIPFHNLRHTCGTMLAEMGVHVRVIQAILRHASHYTTLKFYVHSRDAVESAALEGLSALLVEPDRVLNLAPLDKSPRL